ncbi:MAG: Mur ligase family protein, partial [Candidatus Dormibacteraceae bacterium]
MNKIHFLGIGGAGQSALAELLLARDWQVSGCDLKSSAVIEQLTVKGARIKVDGHHPNHCHNHQLLVYTTRLSPEGEREREAARAAGLRVLSRPQMLAELLADSPSLGVAGTHGKTTTTAMAGYLWRAAGWNPTLLVGDGHSSRVGGERIVAELDESDKSLVFYQPQVAVVTNVEFDHGDYYRDLADVQATFAHFLQHLPAEGLAIICADDPWLLKQSSSARRLTYGFASAADYRCAPDGMISRYGEQLGQLRLDVPGQHNLQNATAVVAAAVESGMDLAMALSGLHGFTGAR